MLSDLTIGTESIRATYQALESTDRMLRESTYL
jgi:hypothetical protein